MLNGIQYWLWDQREPQFMRYNMLWRYQITCWPSHHHQWHRRVVVLSLCSSRAHFYSLITAQGKNESQLLHSTLYSNALNAQRHRPKMNGGGKWDLRGDGLMNHKAKAHHQPAPRKFETPLAHRMVVCFLVSFQQIIMMCTLKCDRRKVHAISSCVAKRRCRRYINDNEVDCLDI